MPAISGGQPQDVILDSINEGVFTVDLDWRITAFNQAAERITGVSRDDALGRPCCEVFRASICENACALRQTLSTGKPVVNATAHIVSHTGQRIPIRISTALLQAPDGSIIGGVETFQDLARAIHNLSRRRKKRFVAINCAALPDTLLESELFGYKAGAFTDARRDKPGRFALADGGTVFLDEIGDISPAMQARLLRVLQERCIEPLGSVESMKVNVRVVAATNKDLAELVRSGVFREDLYYRVRVVHLKLPNLRQRREDIPLLIDRLVSRFNGVQGKDIAGVSGGVLARLMEHDYPGNVRELENIIEQAFVLCRGGLIDLHHLPPELRPAAGRSSRDDEGPTTLESMERMLIAEALRRHEGNRKQAAADLGIDPSTLYRKLKALGIEAPATDGRSRRR